MKIYSINFLFFNNKKQNILLLTFLVLGFAIRLFHYLDNRSLWMDEVYLSTSFIKMNFGELITKPLYYQQKAPIGFLLLVKLSTSIFGNNEIALRLIPFISGLLSMLIFIPLSKFYLKEWPAILAIGILSLSPAIIYHSVEIKQYSTELLGTVLSLLLMLKFRNSQKLNVLLLWGIYGALILWFSYSSIFILAGIGIGLSIQYIIIKKWNLLFLNLIPSVIWVISFCLNYILFTHKHAESEWISYWFKAYNNFMPLFPKSVEDLKWFALNFYRMIDYPLGLLWNFNNFSTKQSINILLKMPIIPIALLLYGFFAFMKKNRYEAVIFYVIIFLTLIASGLQLYPLTERFWVFIAPIFIIILAKGYEMLSEKLNYKYLALLIFILIMIGPLIQSVLITLNPNLFYVHKKSYQRESLEYLNKNIKTGDAVYIYWNNLPGYRIYKEMYNLQFNAIEGNDFRNKSLNYNDYYKNLKIDFNKFENNKRIWLIFNNQFLTDIGDKINEPKWYYSQKYTSKDFLLKKLSEKYNIYKKFSKKDLCVFILIPKISAKSL